MKEYFFPYSSFSLIYVECHYVNENTSREIGPHDKEVLVSNMAIKKFVNSKGTASKMVNGKYSRYTAVSKQVNREIGP